MYKKKMFLNNVNFKNVKGGKIDLNLLTNAIKRNVKEEEENIKKRKDENENENENKKEKIEEEVEEEEFYTDLDDKPDNIKTNTAEIVNAVNMGFNGLNSKVDLNEKKEILNNLNNFNHNFDSFASFGISQYCKNPTTMVKELQDRKNISKTVTYVKPSESQTILDMFHFTDNNNNNNNNVQKPIKKGNNEIIAPPKRGRKPKNKPEPIEQQQQQIRNDSFDVYAPTFPEFINEERYYRDIQLFENDNERETLRLINQMFTCFWERGWLIAGDKFVMNTGTKKAFGELSIFGNEAFIVPYNNEGLIYKNTSIWHAMEYVSLSNKGIEQKALTDLQLLDKVTVLTLNNLTLLSLFHFYIHGFNKTRQDLLAFIVTKQTAPIGNLPNQNIETLLNQYEEKISKLEQKIEDRNLGIAYLLQFNSSFPTNSFPNIESSKWNSTEEVLNHFIENIKSHVSSLDHQ